MAPRKDARLARAKELSYEPVEVDDPATRGQKIYAPSTVREQNYILASYDSWRNHYQNSAPLLEQGVPAPSEEMLIQFAEYIATTGKGNIREKLSVRSCVASIERFFAGFKRITRTEIEMKVRKAVVLCINTHFVLKGIVSTARKAKHLFSAMEYERYTHTLWSDPKNYLEHPRKICNNNFLMGNFSTLGARIGGLLPKIVNGVHTGIRYKDIRIALQRTKGSAWQVIYQLSQRHVKNNKDPENKSYGGFNHEVAVPLLDDTQYLIAFALADGAFQGIKTVDQFFNQRIPFGEEHLPLIWEPDVEDLPIVRSIEQNAVTKKPLLARHFERAFKENIVRTGYRQTSQVRTTVHAIRRAVAKEIDKIYKEAERSQHIGHSDPRVYGDQYVADCSGVDGKSAYFKEAAQFKGIEYFQSFAQWYQPGLPTTLPAQQKAELRQDPELLLLLKEYQQMKQRQASPEEVKAAQQKYQTALARLEREMLQEYQRIWVEQQNLKQISNPSEESRTQKPDQELLRALSRVFPERARLAYALTSRSPVNVQQRRTIIEDLLTAITKDYSVVYLPNESPTDGRCVNPDCKEDINSKPPKERENHTHKCLRVSLAKNLNRSKGELKYCYLCYKWIEFETWNEHCEAHLQDNSWSRCGVFKYGDTIIRPAFCPFCIGNEDLEGGKRMESWNRNRVMRDHLYDHISVTKWPRECPVPCCKLEMSGSEAFLYHLRDNHALNIALESDPKTSKRKPKCERERENERKRKCKRKRDITDDPNSLNVATSSDGAMSSGCSTLPLTTSPMPGADADTIFDCPPITNDQSPGETFMNPEEHFQSSLNVPTSTSDSELYSQFIRSPSPEDDGETANKENLNFFKATCDSSSNELEEVRPEKRLRIILRVRPLSSYQAEPETKNAGRHRRQEEKSKRASTKAKKSKKDSRSKNITKGKHLSLATSR